MYANGKPRHAEAENVITSRPSWGAAHDRRHSFRISPDRRHRRHLPRRPRLAHVERATTRRPRALRTRSLLAMIAGRLAGCRFRGERGAAVAAKARTGTTREPLLSKL